MFSVTVGHDDHIDGASAANAALDQALERCDAAVPKAVMVLVGSGVDAQAVLDTLSARLTGIPLVGATTMVQTSDRGGALEDSVLIWLFSGNGLEVGASVYRLEAAQSPDAIESAIQGARDAVREASGHLEVPARLCLCMGFHPAGPSAFHAGLSQALGSEVPVIGGGALSTIGSGIAGEVFFGRQRLDNAGVVLLLGGRFQMAHAVAHGFQPVGEVHRITRVVAGSVLAEVDGEPAVNLYRNYLGDAGGAGAAFVHHPLAIETPEGQLLRSAFGIGPVPGSLLLAGEVVEGAAMRLCEFDRESLLNAAQAAVAEALARWRGPPPAIALTFECVTRWFALGTLAPLSLARVRDALPASTVVAGSYVAGEFAPWTAGGSGQVHNCSIVVLLLGAA